MERLSILVVEDKEMHRASAKETLSGHNLIIVSSFDEAVKQIEPQIDTKRLYAEIERRLEEVPNEQRGDRWRQLYDELRPSYITRPQFDVVLADLMMPMSNRALMPDVFNPKEQVPYGFVTALLAAKHGVKHVAVITDTNHHHGPMSAALDLFEEHTLEGRTYHRFTTNGTTCMYMHATFLNDMTDNPCEHCTDGGCTLCNGSLKRTVEYQEEEVHCSCTDEEYYVAGKCIYCKGTAKEFVQVRKDWGHALRVLIGQ